MDITMPAAKPQQNKIIKNTKCGGLNNITKMMREPSKFANKSRRPGFTIVRIDRPTDATNAPI